MVMKTALIIQPNGSYELREAADTRELDWIQQIVGGYVEHVTVIYQERRFEGWANENGYAMNLEFNPKATAIYHNNIRKQRGLPTYDDVALSPGRYISRDMHHILGPFVMWQAKDNNILTTNSLARIESK